jgi:hypothetical protein
MHRDQITKKVTEMFQTRPGYVDAQKIDIETVPAPWPLYRDVHGMNP